MTGGNAPNNGGRVTLAVLQNEMQHMRQDVSEMRQEMKYLSGHIAQVANDQLTRITAIETWRDGHKEEHKKESSNQRWFAGILATVESAIAFVASVWAGQP